MKTFVLDALAPEDEEMVVTILEGLRKGNAIQFHSLEEDTPPDAVSGRLQASLNSPRLSWEEGMKRLNL